jgi:hypothetical protein
MGEDNLLVTELLERIRHYKDIISEIEDEAQGWHDAYYELKIEYDEFRAEVFSPDIIKGPPYYDTATPSPTLDNLVDLKKKLKTADTIGC